MNQSKIVTHILPALLAFAGLSGCGNLLKPNISTAPANAFPAQGVAAASTASGNSEFTCPVSPNVLPDVDVWLDGSDTYTVCPSSKNTTDILIHGKTHSSPTVCIAPATYYDANHIYYKPDLATGAPLFQCMDEASAGIAVQFLSMNYNAVFIVEQPDKQQMISCLVLGNKYMCPHYAFGQFRTAKN